jgi:drug/metabolite transporter (DMT)-like permease
MEHLWIAASVMAALCQALRYAALKELNKHLSTMVSTYVRILFSFPFQVVYVAGVLTVTGAPFPHLNAPFLFFSAVTAVGQFMGTAMMIRLFHLGNFAVGTMLTKSDVVLTALIGTAFFSEDISGLGWVAILLTVIGVMVMSVGRLPASAWRAGEIGLLGLLFGRATQIGLTIGLVNGVCYLLLKEAILALEPGTLPVVRAAMAGAAMTTFSVLILGTWLVYNEPRGLARIPEFPGLGWFLGILSAVGTIMWYLATVGANASYVAAVAQVQVVFTLALSRYWFEEKISALELFGMATVLAGVIMFRIV